ncbi:MAG: GNAT family N-acetyltransferase [Acidobacteria bacterium]|nr:MAG: GNAT family N-acetyltransferase [Acidobacteriota bacterium]
MRRQVTTYYLEMNDPSELQPARAVVAELELRQARILAPELNRFLYTAVGGDWFWVDRLSWSYQHWFEHLNRPELETWVAYLSGTPAGYFELERQARGAVELAYFGLLPQFIGRGIGRLLLTHAVERAWELGARRVWLHTCTLDSPAALNNYRARGFRVYREETEEKELPDRSPGPWPGAR